MWRNVLPSAGMTRCYQDRTPAASSEGLPARGRVATIPTDWAVEARAPFPRPRTRERRRYRASTASMCAFCGPFPPGIAARVPRQLCSQGPHHAVHGPMSLATQQKGRVCDFQVNQRLSLRQAHAHRCKITAWGLESRICPLRRSRGTLRCQASCPPGKWLSQMVIWPLFHGHLPKARAGPPGPRGAPG